MIAAITTSAPITERTGAAAAAITLRASLEEQSGLSAGEKSLLGELLDRIVSA